MRQGLGRGARQYTINKSQSKLNSSMSNSTNQDKSSDHQKVNTNLYTQEHESAPFKVNSDKMISMSPKEDSSDSNDNYFIDIEPSGSHITESQKKKYGLDQINLNSSNQFGYGSTQWKYQDEENTPAINSKAQDQGYELKSMSYKEATVIKTSQSGLQDHYTSISQSSVKHEPSASSSAYHSAYTGMVSMSPQKPSGQSMMGEVIGQPQSQRLMPTFNNDFEAKNDPKSKQYAYDEMFEKAEMTNTQNKEFIARESFSQLKIRDDENNIRISMSHGSDSNEKSEKKQGKKMKSRIGLREFDEDFEPADHQYSDFKATTSTSLNSSQSQSYLNYMREQEKKQDEIYQMKSKYGQNYVKQQVKQSYMKQQVIQAQERKLNKLSNQIKEDIDLDQVPKPDESAIKIQSQIEKRRLKKKTIDEDAEQPATFCGNLVSSLFTEDGRANQEVESNKIRKQSLKDIIGEHHDNIFTDIDGEETNMASDAFRKETEDITQRFINQSKSKDSYIYKEHAELEGLKHELPCFEWYMNKKTGEYEKKTHLEIEEMKMAMSAQYDTVHPKKIISEISDSVSDSNKQQASKNIFSNYIDQDRQKMSAMQQMLENQRGVTGSSMGYGSQYQTSFPNRNTQAGFKGASQTGFEPQMKNHYQEQFGSSFSQQQDYSTQNMYGMHSEKNIYNINGINMNSKNPYYGAGYSTSSMYDKQIYQSQQSLQQQSKSLENSAAVDKYFYESPSKYISLKKFSEAHYQFQDFSKKRSKDSQNKVQSLYLQMAELKQKQHQKEFCNKYNLQQWFQGLLNHEKSIVLTVIDSELINLIKAMHKKYVEFGHGFYYSTQVGYKPLHSVQDAERIEKIEGYEQKLCFQKPKFSKPYDYYGTSSQQSPGDKEQKQYQDQLITNIKIIKVGDQEAITLSNDMIENTNFLLRMFQSVEKNFMSCELKVEKTEGKNAMDYSVFSKYQTSGEQEKNEAAQSRKKKDQDIYFTLNERDVKQTAQSKIDSQSVEFRDRRSQYGRLGTKPHPAVIPKQIITDKSAISLGLILCHIFEKAINIQYQEFQSKTNAQMNQFFYSQNDNSIFNQDLKLAKFWRDLKSNERSQFWRKVTDAQEQLIDEIKLSYLYQNMKHIEDIQEETETETESNSRSANGMTFSSGINKSGARQDIKHRQQLTEYSEVESQEASSDSGSRGSQINWGHQGSKKSELKASRLNRNYLNSDDQSGNSSDAKKSQSDNDSDDIEKNQKKSFKNNYDQGYRPLKGTYDSLDNFGNISKQRATSRSIIGQPLGKGYKALDQLSDSDRTITENSENSSNEEINRYKRTLPNQSAFFDPRYKNQDRLKPMYQTTSDPKDLTKSDQTDYEKDKFEAQSDDDDDDDFNLPKGHEQNAIDKIESNQYNIKQKIIEQKQERQKRPKGIILNSMAQSNFSNKPKEYQSTGTQATNAALKAQNNQANKDSKGKKQQPKEEKKLQIQSKSQKLKSQQSIIQNKECQKENQVRKSIKILLTKLESMGSKAVPEGMIGDDQNITVLDECYLFIRQISTFSSLKNSLAKKSQNQTNELQQQADQKVYEMTYKHLQQEQNTKDLNDLMDEDDLDEPAVSSATVQKSNKAAKKKAKKEREKLQKEQAAEAKAQEKSQETCEKDKIEEMRKDIMNLTQEHNNELVAKTNQSSTKQISHILNDDIVVIKDVPAENQTIQESKKSKKSKRRQKKNKKGMDNNEPEGEQDGKNKEEQKDTKDENQLTKLIQSNQISAIGLVEDGGIKSVAQKKAVEALADVIIKQSVDNQNEQIQSTPVVDDPSKILQVLQQHDDVLRKTEDQQAAIFKKMLFPDGDFSDSSKSETGSQKLLSSCEKIRSRIEGSIKHNLSSSPRNMNDFVQAQQQNRYVRERTSLITEKFDQDKYPDQTEIQKLNLNKSDSKISSTDLVPASSNNFYDEMGEMAEMNLKEKEPDLYLEQIGQELQNDPEMIGFNTPYHRSKQDIQMSKQKLAKGTAAQQKMLQQQEENKKMISEQDSLMQSLEDLSGKVGVIGQQVNKEKKSLIFTDLKQERDRLAAPPPEQSDSPGKILNSDLISLNTDKIAMDINAMMKNKKATDYCEKVDDDLAGNEEEGKKKKPKKRKKKKKKGEADAAQEEIKQQDMINQTEQWQKELCTTLNKEKNSDDEFSNEGDKNMNKFEIDDDDMFDDNFMTSNPNYIQMKQIYSDKAIDKKKDDSSDYMVKPEDIFVNMDPVEQIGTRDKEFTVCMTKIKENYKKKQEQDSKLEQVKKNIDRHFDIHKQEQTKSGLYTAVMEPVEQIEVQLIENIPTLDKPDSDDEAASEVQQAEAPKLSKKAQAKLDKKKEEKQKAKQREIQRKEREAELKEQKAQKKKEIQNQKKLQEMKQTQIQAEPKKEEDHIVHTLNEKDQRLMKLPGLNVLNSDKVEQHGGGSRSESESHSIIRNNTTKRVTFQRDESYDESKVPKRGSSRGSSVALSNKNKEDDIVLDDLDDLFPKEYVKPQEETCQSIIDSLDNSKKNSLESSTNKSGKDDREAQSQAKMLHKKLSNLANVDQIGSGTLKADRFRSSSGTQKKRGRSQSPSPKENEIMMQNIVKKGKNKTKKNADKSMDASKVVSKSNLVQDSINQTPDNQSVKSSLNSKKAPVKEEPIEQAPIKFEIIRPAPQPKQTKAQKKAQKKLEFELKQKTTKKVEPEEVVAQASKETTKKKSKQAAQKEVKTQPNNLYVQAFNAASNTPQQPAAKAQSNDKKVDEAPVVKQPKKKSEKQKAIVPADLPDDLDLNQKMSQILNDVPKQTQAQDAKQIQSNQIEFSQVNSQQNNIQNIPFSRPQNEVMIQNSSQNAIGNSSPADSIQEQMMRYMNQPQNIPQGIQNMQQAMFQGMPPNQASQATTDPTSNQSQTQIQVDLIRFTIQQNQLPAKNDSNSTIRSQQSNPQPVNQPTTMQSMFQAQQQNTANAQQLQSQNQWAQNPQSNPSNFMNPQMHQNFGNMQNIMNMQSSMQQNLVNMQNMQNMQNSMMAHNMASNLPQNMQQNMNMQMMQNMQNQMSQNNMGMPQMPSNMNQFNYQNNPNNFKNFQGNMPQYNPHQMQSMLNQSGNFQMGFNPNTNFQNMSPMNQQIMSSQSQSQNKSTIMPANQSQGSSPQFTQPNSGMNFGQQPGFNSPQSQYAQQMNAYMLNQNNKFKPNQLQTQSSSSNSNQPMIQQQQQTSPQKANANQPFVQNNQNSMMMGASQSPSQMIANQHNPQLFFQYQQQFQQKMQNNQHSIQGGVSNPQQMPQIGANTSQIQSSSQQNSLEQSSQFNSQSPNFTPQNLMIQNQFQNKQKTPPFGGQQNQSIASGQGSGQKPVVQSKVIEIADQLGAVLPKQTNSTLNIDSMPLSDSQSNSMLQVPGNQFMTTQSSSPNQMMFPNQSRPQQMSASSALTYNPLTGQPIQTPSNQVSGNQLSNASKKGSQQKANFSGNQSNSQFNQSSGQIKSQSGQNNQLRGQFDSSKPNHQQNLQQYYQPNNNPSANQNYYNTQSFNQTQHPQHQQMLKIQQLQSQGYVLDINDLHVLNQLKLEELNYVHEFYEVLDAQILKLKQDQEIKLQKTQKLRNIAFNVVKDQIKSVYKNRRGGNKVDHENIKVEVYGSMATGLAIDSSDLDILVSDFINQSSPRFKGISRQELIEEMQDIHQALNDIFALKTNTLIESASVPVIKLQINLGKLYEREIQRDPSIQKAFGLKLQEIVNDDELKTLNIDITLNEPRKVIEEIHGPTQPSVEHLGLQCCKYIKSRLEEHTQMKTLALVFKKFLSLKDLNKPFSGGLSSYSLVQMILVILRQNQQFFGMKNKQNIGMLFKQFIWEYGFQFQPTDRGITQDGQFLAKSEFQYIYHSITCNINLRIMEEEQINLEGDQIEPKARHPISLDPLTCTCGFTKNQIKSGAQNVEGTQNNQIVHLLSKLLNNQPDEDSPEFKANRGALSYLNQTQLIIVDPLNKFNNIGRSSYNFSVVQEELRHVYYRLNDEMVKFVKYASSCNSLIGQPNQLQDLHLDSLIPRILLIDYHVATQEIQLAQPQIEEEDKKEHSPPSQSKKVQSKPKEEAKTKSSPSIPQAKALNQTPKSKKNKAKANNRN